MQAQTPLQTVTFLLKRRNFYGNPAKIMEAAGLQYFHFDLLYLDDWEIVDLTVYWCGCKQGSAESGHPVYFSCWYQYRPMCYGTNKDPRGAPETYLSVTFPSNGLDQAATALAFTKFFEGTELEIEGGAIEAPIDDFVEKLHELIS